MKLIKTLTFAAFAAGLGLVIYMYLFSLNSMDSNATNKIEFDLLKGMRPMEISSALEKAGIIKDRHAMFWVGKITGGWTNIRAADYELSASMSPNQIFKTFKSGIGIQHSILVREGDNLYQVAKTLEEQKLSNHVAMLKLFRNHDFIAGLGLDNEGLRSLEGYLFPNTYFYDKHDGANSVVKRMVDAFIRTWTPEYEARSQELGMTRYQIVILASMIEKETGASFERPIISSVFHNRLRKKMRLQSDPTTIYGMWERYDGNIHKKDLSAHNEYNTYTIPALPVGPISNPSAEAVKAALYPADTEYLYFVSKNDGTHMFSKTYDEHVGWVKKTQLDPRAREGKSWRDLKKNQAAGVSGAAPTHP